jgi:hypothetical protein
MEDVTILQNQGVQTDTEVLANRPDTVIKKTRKIKFSYWQMCKEKKTTKN